MNSDLFFAIKWWLYLLGIGIIFFPLTERFFRGFFDRGYIFSKTFGIVIIGYAIFVLGILRLLPFHRISIFSIVFIFFILGIYIFRRWKIKLSRKEIFIILFQEVLFLFALLFWSYIKSFQPDIHGLEKYMDYGFINSILRSTYFPPIDMWFPPHSINYYYFGHLITAMLIKLSGVPNFIAYNLMLSTIFAFTVTSSFSIVSTLSHSIIKISRTSFLSGILAGIVTALGGNLHTIYAFFAPYSPPENPVPFWTLKFLPTGLVGFPNNYWYPNATRFIPYTIHEFPSYSFVVSDLHGHVLDIPFVFLTLGLFLSLFLSHKVTVKRIILISFMLAIMYMTNAWDGIIYFLLLIFSILLLKSSVLKAGKKKKKIRLNIFDIALNKKAYLKSVAKLIIIAGLGYVLFSLPFNLTFKPFVSGVGVLCAPDFLINIGSIGPVIFEKEHCQRTPLWMLIILYGFFYFYAIALVFKIIRLSKTPLILIFVLTLILLSTLLIAAPEFIYAKDIYPAHYRANTMFKLGYQAFMMLSLVACFSIAYLFHNGKRILWIPITFILLFLVLIYPYFAVISYFGNLKDFKGLNGISYLQNIYPDDLKAILWINTNIKNQPVILEAQGDSYTDYGRISANTGLPTPLGWTVHEWLWRGDYSFPQSRLEDVRLLYEGTEQQIRSLVAKYNVKYVYIGTLESTKYSNLNYEAIGKLGKVVFKNGTATIYKIN